MNDLFSRPLQIDSLNGVGHGGGDLGAGRIVGNAQLGRVGRALLHGPGCRA